MIPPEAQLPCRGLRLGGAGRWRRWGRCARAQLGGRQHRRVIAPARAPLACDKGLRERGAELGHIANGLTGEPAHACADIALAHLRAPRQLGVADVARGAIRELVAQLDQHLEGIGRERLH